jgi:curved DNA-binding protein CbpA
MPPSSRAPDHRGAHQRAADLYEVLGVSPDAEIGELASAYRRRLRQLHPDTRRAHHADQQPSQHALPSLAEVLNAYAVLRDPIQRAGYDHARTTQPHTDPAGSAASSSGAIPIPVRHRRTTTTGEQPPPANNHHRRTTTTNTLQPRIRVGPVRRHLLPPR